MCFLFDCMDNEVFERIPKIGIVFREISQGNYVKILLYVSISISQRTTVCASDESTKRACLYERKITKILFKGRDKSIMNDFRSALICEKKFFFLYFGAARHESN